MNMTVLLVLAGIGQLALAVGSLAIPKMLNWREQTACLEPLTREVFWTYAAYIWTTNVAFGVLSSFCSAWLLDGTPLARAVCGFIALYWGARLAIQFVAFGKHAPPGKMFRFAEVALVLLFVYLTLVYAAIACGLS